MKNIATACMCIGWKCHAFIGCMGQPSTFNEFNKSESLQERTFRFKRENFCDCTRYV